MTNNKAREINSPLIKQLIDETTPQELAKIDTEMSNNKQQTAVEWLEKICNDRGYYLMSEYFEKAKAMHKEEIINSFFEGAYGGDNISGEQYYNETYGGNNEQ